MQTKVHAVSQPNLPPFTMPHRFKQDVVYFVTSPGEPGAPESLEERHYFVRREDAERVYDEGIIRIVSPLDSDSSTEIEITEEQERWLEWMLDNDVQEIRLE